MNSPLSEKALCDLGAKIGADIPFCLVGGTAVVRGYGEIIEPIDPLPPCHILIAKPAVGISTAACFARYDESGIPLALPGTPPVKAAIQEGDIAAVGEESLQCAGTGLRLRGDRPYQVGDARLRGRRQLDVRLWFGGVWALCSDADAEAAARRLKLQRYFVRRCSPIQYGGLFCGIGFSVSFLYNWKISVHTSTRTDEECADFFWRDGRCELA